MQLVGYINDLEKARDAVDSAAELLLTRPIVFGRNTGTKLLLMTRRHGTALT